MNIAKPNRKITKFATFNFPNYLNAIYSSNYKYLNKGSGYHQIMISDLGHPNKMFCFPSPSTRMVESVGWIKKKSKNNFKVIQFV